VNQSHSETVSEPTETIPLSPTRILDSVPTSPHVDQSPPTIIPVRRSRRHRQEPDRYSAELFSMKSKFLLSLVDKMF